MVKNPPANAKDTTVTTSLTPDFQEDPLESKMATHSSILAWKIPWTGDRDRLQVHWVTKSQTRLSEHTHMHIRTLLLS